MKQIILLLILISFSACNSEAPKEIGVVSYHLHPCPTNSKCLSSSSPQEQKDQYISPISIEEPVQDIFNKFHSILTKRNDTVILRRDPSYIHAQITKGLFSAIYEFELFYSEYEKVVHIKLHSRSKLPDFGATKTLLEEIKFKYFQKDY